MGCEVRYLRGFRGGAENLYENVSETYCCRRCTPCLAFPCRLPAKPLGREKAFPAVVRKSVPKALQCLGDGFSYNSRESLFPAERLCREPAGKCEARGTSST